MTPIMASRCGLLHQMTTFIVSLAPSSSTLSGENSRKSQIFAGFTRELPWTIYKISVHPNPPTPCRRPLPAINLYLR